MNPRIDGSASRKKFANDMTVDVSEEADEDLPVGANRRRHIAKQDGPHKSSEIDPETLAAEERRKKRRSGWSSVPESDIASRVEPSENKTTGFSGPAVGDIVPTHIDSGRANFTSSMSPGDSALATSRLHLLGQQLGLTSEQMKSARELYLCNLPPAMEANILVDFMNAALLALKGNCLPGNPAVKGWISAENNFATIEFRTMEEANNGLALNGINCFGYNLRIGRPKTYPEDLAKVPAAQQITMPPTSGITNGIVTGVSLNTTVNKELLGAAFSEGASRMSGTIVTSVGAITPPPDAMCLRGLPAPQIFSEERARELLTAFGPLKFFLYFGLPSVVDIRRVLSDHISQRSQYDVQGYPIRKDPSVETNRVIKLSPISNLKANAEKDETDGSEEKDQKDTKNDKELNENVLQLEEKCVKMEQDISELDETENLPPRKSLADRCAEEIFTQEAVESVCFFEFSNPLDSQNLSTEIESMVFAGMKPKLDNAEIPLAEEDFMRFAVHYIMERKCEPNLTVGACPIPVPTRVLCFENLVTIDELIDDTEYFEILEDVQTECKKSGRVIGLHIPRPVGAFQQQRSASADRLEEKMSIEESREVAPQPPDDNTPELDLDRSGIGYVFVEFASIAESCRARKALNCRKFSSRGAQAFWISERIYAKRDFCDLQPNVLKSDSSEFCPELAAHVPAMIKQMEEQERIGREAARQAATAAANASFSGQSGLGLPATPLRALLDVPKPDFDEDVVKDDEAMDEED